MDSGPPLTYAGVSDASTSAPDASQPAQNAVPHPSFVPLSTANHFPPSNAHHFPPSNAHHFPPSNANYFSPSDAHHFHHFNGNYFPPSNGNYFPPSNAHHFPPSNANFFPSSSAARIPRLTPRRFQPYHRRTSAMERAVGQQTLEAMISAEVERLSDEISQKVVDKVLPELEQKLDQYVERITRARVEQVEEATKELLATCESLLTGMYDGLVDDCIKMVKEEVLQRQRDQSASQPTGGTGATPV